MLLSFFMIHLKCCYRYCRMVQCLLKSNHLVIKVLIRFEAWDWRGPDLISTSHSGNIVLQIYNYTGLWYTSLFPKIFVLHLQYFTDGCKWLDTHLQSNQVEIKVLSRSGLEIGAVLIWSQPRPTAILMLPGYQVIGGIFAFEDPGRLFFQIIGKWYLTSTFYLYGQILWS